MNISLRRRFGMRIRELRQANGLSQESLADQAGFARTYLSRIETGGANPSLDAIETLASALQTSVDRLFVVAAGPPDSQASRHKNSEIRPAGRARSHDEEQV